MEVNMAIREHAESIARNASPDVGLSEAWLLPLLLDVLPSLFRCLSKSELPSMLLQQSWMPDEREFQGPLVRRVARRYRTAAYARTGRRMTDGTRKGTRGQAVWEQVYSLSEHTLREGLLETTDLVACHSEAMQAAGDSE